MNALNYDILRKQIINAYRQAKQENKTVLWSIEEITSFFEYYYKAYKAYTGNEHIHLKTETIKRVIELLNSDGTEDYTLQTSIELLPQYFETNFSVGNHAITHFVSGNVRLNRMYELGYI